MKQHPIPQNVLDVEFKLFTKLTLKEFGYLAAGVVTGSLFLLLNRQVGLPAIIAWPAFLLLSGIGLFFALVPINDQNADEFVRNYFKAINKPTQRVWLNEEMKENRTKPVINTEIEEGKKIIGGSTGEKIQAFQEKPGDDIFSTEHEQNTSTSVVQEHTVTDSPTKTLVIGPQNISQYQFSVQSVDRFPGNINIWLADMNNRGVSNVPVFLKNKDGQVIFANRTGPNGYFLSNQILPPGVYYIHSDQSVYDIPLIQLILEGNESKNPLKITATLKK